jgi:hypothetical protein
VHGLLQGGWRGSCSQHYVRCTILGFSPRLGWRQVILLGVRALPAALGLVLGLDLGDGDRLGGGAGLVDQAIPWGHSSMHGAGQLPWRCGRAGKGLASIEPDVAVEVWVELFRSESVGILVEEFLSNDCVSSLVPAIRRATAQSQLTKCGVSQPNVTIGRLRPASLYSKRSARPLLL